MEPSRIGTRPRAVRARQIAPPRRRPAFLGVALVAALAVAACTTGAGTVTGSPSASAAPGATASPGASAPASPAARVSTAAEAFAVVQARSPYFDGAAPRDAQAIGQAAWWQAVPATPGADGAWGITVSVGWGDCPAGCTSSHVWRWSVAADGATTLADESGPAIPDDVRSTLVAAATTSGVGGAVTAAPTCPVVRPGESGCDDRPVDGAMLVVRDAGGAEVARFTTDGSGLFRIALAPGSYALEPQPRAGLIGTARPQPFTVGDAKLTFVAVGYDTGIR